MWCNNVENVIKGTVYKLQLITKLHEALGDMALEENVSFSHH